MLRKTDENYTLKAFPRLRRFSIDAGVIGRRRNTMHGLIEIDISEPRRILAEHHQQTGEKLSFTAYLITCLAQAIAEYPEVQAWRDWRGRLVIFENVDISILIEIDSGRGKIVLPHTIKAIDQKTFRQIHDEIRTVQNRPSATREHHFMSGFLSLPGFLRTTLEEILQRFPVYTRHLVSPVQVSAVGMFGTGGGWAVPLTSFPLCIFIGGIQSRPGIWQDQISIREFLQVTVSFNHDIIDGAPAARFTNRFRQLVESCAGLENLIPQA